MQFDHLVLAARDLERAKRHFHSATGVLPEDGGPHPGRGTRNALISFEPGHYLEIIAPDPEQSQAAEVAASFGADEAGQIHHWALGNSDLPALSRRASAAGFSPGPIVSMSRVQPGGSPLEWDLLGIGGHAFGGFVPFFIDWRATPHPSRHAPEVGPLDTLTLRLPESSPLRALLDPMPSGVKVIPGALELSLRFESPRGPIEFSATKVPGFPF
jgi:hypothetical protein